jgi:hypothetical protein
MIGRLVKRHSLSHLSDICYRSAMPRSKTDKDAIRKILQL